MRICVVVLLGSVCFSAASAEAPKAEVMIMGVFHFANPGLDAVKTPQIDVMTEDNQRYLQGLAERLAGFEPTAVLTEFLPRRSDSIQAQYREYLAGNFELPANEVYQLGFRVAKLASLESVHGFDDQGVHWQGDVLVEYLETDEKAMLRRLEAVIAEVTEETTRAHQTLSFAELLEGTNDPRRDKRNKSFYILTNAAGAGDGFEGAAAAARWWHRNFRMYARVQTYAGPGERVLVIGGQGHTAILKDLLAMDPDREAVDVRPLLAP